jgi:hypothetical protein
MHPMSYLESTPDNIPIEWAIPLCIMLGLTYFVQGSKARREARKARLNR